MRRFPKDVRIDIEEALESLANDSRPERYGSRKLKGVPNRRLIVRGYRRAKRERMQDKAAAAFHIPDPAFTMEVEGNSMVAIPVEVWERIVEELEDSAAASQARAIMADARDPIIPLEEGRRELFDNHIKRVRKRKGLTQVQLAKKLGISQGRVSEIEHLDYRPTIKTYRRVAKALGVDITELI